jgi:hypothetical protein
MGKFAEAKDVLHPLEQRFMKVFGPDHPELARCREILALTEEGLGHLENAESLLLKSHATLKRELGDGHRMTRRAVAHLGRICMERGKTDEGVGWLRILLTTGVARTGKGIAQPTGHPVATLRGVPDINFFGDALEGKGDPRTREALLRELGTPLDWLMWRKDWLRAHVSALVGELSLHRELAKETDPYRVDDIVAKGSAIIRSAVKTMEGNAATPPRFLEEQRARLKRVADAEANWLQSPQQPDDVRRLRQALEAMPQAPD